MSDDPGVVAAQQDRPTGLWMSMRARDARGLIRFLVDALGFEEVVVYDGEDGRVLHAELAWPLGGGLMLGTVSDHGDPPVGSAMAYLLTDDPDGAFARAIAAGASVLTPPGDTDYGSREFAVADPEGNRWSLGTYAGHRAQPPAP